MTSDNSKTYDVLVVGGGISGMQTALDLADQDFKVAIIEKDPSIGGKMIRLDKVFPTLDCASCITTPKMASVAHHKNIDIFTMCDIQSLDREKDIYNIKVEQKPRYVEPETCIGCRQCEYACPIMAPDENQRGLTARKAIYIPFTNAIPQIATLDVEYCILCGKCQKICPTQAVNYLQEPYIFEMEARAVVFAMGYQLIKGFAERAYGSASQNPNIIDALQLERILAPTGPYMRMLRPGDGKEPKKIAFIKCAGSRDEALGVSYCSRVCCMYSIKNGLLIQQELPSAEITMFYIDTRAFGKNYEQFFRNAKDKGIKFIKAKPTISGSGKDRSVIIRYEDQEGPGGVVSEEYDMAVLCLAMISALSPNKISEIPVSDDGFMKSSFPKIAPTVTDMEGVFIAGTISGPKDIVDSIIEAGAAAMEAANYLKSLEQPQAVAA